MKIILNFLLFGIIMIPNVLYGQSNIALLRGQYSNEDFISFHTLKNANDMCRLDSNLYFFETDSVSKLIKPIAIKVDRSIIVYLINKSPNQYSAYFYLYPTDTVNIISKDLKSNYYFSGNRENEWNFPLESKNAGYPLMGENWTFNRVDQNGYLETILQKRESFYEFLKIAKDSLSLSERYIINVKRDAEAVFLLSAIESYNYQDTTTDAHRKFVSFVKDYASFFVRDTLQKSWSYYRSLIYWNAFLTKTFYCKKDTPENQFIVARRTDAAIKDDLMFLILKKSEKWTSEDNYAKYANIFDKENKNLELATSLSFTTKVDTGAFQNCLSLIELISD